MITSVGMRMNNLGFFLVLSIINVSQLLCKVFELLLYCVRYLIMLTNEVWGDLVGSQTVLQDGPVVVHHGPPPIQPPHQLPVPTVEHTI